MSQRELQVMLGVLALVQLKTLDLGGRSRSTSIMCGGEEGRASSKWKTKSKVDRCLV
jgi:hypothetical protein